MRSSNRQYAVAVFATLLMGVGTAATRADVFELTNGGRIVGRLAAGDEDSDAYVINTPDGKLTIARSQVAKVESTSAAEAQYAQRARTTPDTVEAHWELAEWCREHKLRDESQKHLARILELDPHHEQARALLGFKRKNGEWMTRDELMASRGLVLYDGRYVTPQHVELMERDKAAKLSQADWSDRLERARRALVGRREDRAAQALADVRDIRDPMAAEPLLRMLRREENAKLKREWIDVAARINHPACVRALVDLSLYDTNEDVRHQALEHLLDARLHGIVTPYVRALRHKNNEVVNRAAAALGQLGDRDAIAPLIDALVTKHKFQIGGGSPGQQGYTFSPESGAFSFGGGGPQIIERNLQNPAVLSALTALTGTSFDFDEQAWRAWLASQTKLHTVDVRRDN